MEAHAIFEPLDPALVSIVVEFNQLLDDNSANISRAKALVLDLEERLEQLGTPPNTVSISIKRKLQRKIAERKISTQVDSLLFTSKVEKSLQEKGTKFLFSGRF